MNGKHRIFFAALAVCLLLALAACSREQEERDEDEAVLNLQLDAEVSTLDPQAAMDSASFEVIALLMEGLYEIDENEQPVPAMAESVQVLDGEKTYQFTLRQAVWSDGTPVRAQDFVYGWRRGIDPENGNENAGLFAAAGIESADEILAGECRTEKLGIEAADDRTLVVRLEEPVPYFLSMLSLPVFYPMNERFCENAGTAYGSSPDTVLSNGAFCLAEYEPAAQEILLEKNSSYWAKDAVELDRIHYQVIKDSQTAVMAYESGQMDMALLSGDQARNCRSRQDFRTIPLGSLWYLVPNLEVEELANQNLRMALALSYDKEEAASQVLGDGSRPAWGAVPSGAMYGPDGRDFRDQAETYLKTDKSLAAEYLKEAQKELNQEKFSFTLLIEDTDAAQNLGQYLQAQISSALPDIEIELESVPKKMRLERMAQGEFQIGLTRWGADYQDPLAFLNLWTGESAFNYGAWSSEAYDELIRQAQREEMMSQPETRWDLLHQAEGILMNQAGIFPVCEKANGILLSPKVMNAQFHAVGINRVWKYVRLAEAGKLNEE